VIRSPLMTFPLAKLLSPASVCLKSPLRVDHGVIFSNVPGYDPPAYPMDLASGRRAVERLSAPWNPLKGGPWLARRGRLNQVKGLRGFVKRTGR